MSAPDFTSFGLALTPVPRQRGWFRGSLAEVQVAKDLAARVRVSPAASEYQIFVGLLGDDQGHRIYVTPPLSLRELIETFRVGEHGAESYGFEAEETIARVADRLDAVAQICPFIVTFLDSAGLHAEFTRQLDEAAAARIERLYGADDAMQDGLDSYVSEWSGEGPLMVPALLEEQTLRLWWD